MNRSGLGRGLSALLPDSASPEARTVAQVSIAEIRTNPYQPRQVFNDDSLAELADSIRQHGLMQPITLRSAPDGNGFQLVAGERRLRAATLAGLEAVPALVIACNERQMLEMALVENLQREDINALDAARAYRQYLEEFGQTQEELAERVGKSRTAVANTLRLLKLGAPVQEMIADGRLSEGHGRALLALVDEGGQLQLARRIVQEGLSVREAERLAREVRERGRPAREPAAAEAAEARERTPLDPDLADFADRLQRALGTRVDLRPSGEGGTIVIRYYSAEDLARIAEALDA